MLDDSRCWQGLPVPQNYPLVHILQDSGSWYITTASGTLTAGAVYERSTGLTQKVINHLIENIIKVVDALVNRESRS